MARERLVIEVTEKGAKVVAGRIGGIGKQAKVSAGGVSLLTRALALLGGTLVIRQLVSLSDQFTNIQNRLKIVTGSTEQLVAVQKELLQVSNDTRTSFQTNAELFTRTAIATRELGLSQGKTLDFTKALSQAVILSGASAIEASNAIRQLSQGLQSGELRGEEFRAVSEQLPIVLDILAKDLDITRGKLRELAFQGKITAEVLVSGILRAQEDLEEQFKKTTPTIGQAIQVLKNNALDLVGTFSTGTGIGREFAETVLILAKNLGLVARVLAAGGIALAIGAITNALNTLRLAIATNPLGLIVTGATLAIGALVAFSDQIKLTETGVADFRDFLVVTAVAFQGIFVTTLENATAVLQTFTGNLKTSAENGESTILLFIRAVARAVDFLGGLFVGLKNFIVGTFEDLPRALSNIFVAALNGVIQNIENTANRIINIINPIITFAGLEPLVASNIGRLELPFQDAAVKLGESFVKGFQEGVGAEDLVDSLILGSEARAQKRLSDTALKDFKQGEAAKALAEDRAAFEVFDAEREAKRRDSLTGFQNGLAQLESDITDFATQTENALVNAFTSAEDALVDFIVTGKADFAGLVDSMLRDLVRLALRQALVGGIGLLAGGGGGGGGGIGGGFPSIAASFGGGRQNGGPVDPGRSFLVGEQGPELITPRVPGQVTPLAAQEQAPPVVNVINVMDPEEVTGALNSTDGQDAILNVIRRNRESVRNSLA